MSAPKSVVKFSKNGVEFTSSVDRSEYYLFELTRAALRDVARFLQKKYRERYYQLFQRHTGKGPRAISSVVYSSKTTKYPRLEIGIKHSAPGRPVPGWYTYFHEVGTNREPKRPVLEVIVRDNIAEIRKIESAYLSAVEDPTQADRLIESEDEYREEES